MTETNKSSLTLCEACRRPIRKGDRQRIIQGYRIHGTDDCLYLYTVKVEKGIFKTSYTASIRKTNAKS